MPVAARLPYYEMFAKRGTCVLAEKPLAMAEAEAESVFAIGIRNIVGLRISAAKLWLGDSCETLVAENWFGPLGSVSVSEVPSQRRPD